MNENPIDHQEQEEDINDEVEQGVEGETNPVFNNNVAELISSVVLIATLTLNTEAIGPNLEMAAGAFHLLTFLLLKEAWRAKQEGEYSKQDLTKAVARIAAPFLTAGVINNSEAIVSTLSSIDQTIGFSQAAADIIPKIVGVLGVGSVAAVGVVKAGNELVKGYRSLKTGLTNKMNQASEYIKSFEPQNPVRDLSVPLKKVEFQNPIKSAEWQLPFKLSLPWRRRAENG